MAESRWESTPTGVMAARSSSPVRMRPAFRASAEAVRDWGEEVEEEEVKLRLEVEEAEEVKLRLAEGTATGF